MAYRAVKGGGVQAKSTEEGAQACCHHGGVDESFAVGNSDGITFTIGNHNADRKSVTSRAEFNRNYAGTIGGTLCRR